MPAIEQGLCGLELELELIQAHMTQKTLLWIEVGAHAVRKRSECAGVVCASALVAGELLPIFYLYQCITRMRMCGASAVCECILISKALLLPILLCRAGLYWPCAPATGVLQFILCRMPWDMPVFLSSRFG
jgi:hypothetical protein